MTQMNGKIVLVTGSNSGIGKVTARELAKMGATVIMVARSETRGSEALAEVKAASGSTDVHLMLCDLSSQADIHRFADEFQGRYDRLDVLVNNAGAFFQQRQESVDGLEKTFAVNHMGYFLLTRRLLPLLQAADAGRIVNVSSDAHRVNEIDFDDLQREQKYSSFQVYGETKLMNIMFTYQLARELADTAVTVNALHPGFVRTNFARRSNGLAGKLLVPLIQLFGISEDKGAETQIYLASSPEVAGVTGKYFVKKKPVQSADFSYREEMQQKLWDVSEAALVDASRVP